MSEGVEYEMPDVLTSSFDDDELEDLLDKAGSMTPGVYFVPPLSNSSHAPHLIQVAIGSVEPLDPKCVYYENYAAVLSWGPDVLRDQLNLMDKEARTHTLHRIANAHVIQWTGNNLEDLLQEFIAMRQTLDSLDLIKISRVECPACDATGGRVKKGRRSECSYCSGNGVVSGKEARDMFVEAALRKHEKKGST